MRRALLTLLGLCISVLCAQEPTSVGSGPHHWANLRPGDPLLGRLLEKNALVHLEDYGSFAMAVFDERAFGGRAAVMEAGFDLCDHMRWVGFAGAAVDTSSPETVAASLLALPEDLRIAEPDPRTLGASRTWMVVQFQGPMRDLWRQKLEGLGIEIISYMPENALVVAVDGSTLPLLKGACRESHIRWNGVYQPAWKLAPDIRNGRGAGLRDVVVQVIADERAAATVIRIAAEGRAQRREASVVAKLLNIHVTLPDTLLPSLAADPWVAAIETDFPNVMFDEAQGQIMAGNISGNAPSGAGYLTWLAGRGFAQSGQFAFAVDVTDDGVDRGSMTDVPAEFRELGAAAGLSRIAYHNNYTGDALADGGGGHGHLNASIIFGYNNLTGTAVEDANFYNYGLGIAPFVKVGNSKVFANSGSWTASASTATRLSNAYNGGARFSSNSWGNTTGNSYTTDSQAHDAAVRDATTATGLQELSIIFSAGNSGSAANTVRPPSTAKNIICVGASENVRQTGTDGCGIANTGADSLNDIISFSSRGPCSDGRKKPDLVAPGTHVQAAASRSVNYNGIGVCNQYWPAGQTLYAWSSGTSHSCPAAAGAAALVRQYFVNNAWATPSPAMVKAVLMTTTRYLTGTGAAGTLWSTSQGMGAVDLGRAFNGSANIRHDQATVLGASGATWSVSGNIASSTQPVRVGLVWTDAVGTTTGSAWVNNLDLEVTVNGTLYRGNVFSGASSITGGTADAANNAEFVFLPAGTTGSITVTVRATNIAGDGVPGNADTTDQDFALFVQNVVEGAPVPDFSLSATPSSASITSGASASFTVANTASGGFASAITLSASPVITGVSYGFSANPMAVGGTSNLTVTTSASTPAGNYTITVSGTGGGLTRTTSVLLVVSAPGAGVKTWSRTPNVAIPNNNATGITSTIAVTDSMTVSSVAVTLNIQHTAKGDLTVSLIAPNGTARILHNMTGGTTPNIVTTYAIVTTPNQALTTFNTYNSAGTWTLKVTDTKANNTGTLVSWSMTFAGEKSASPNLAIPDNNTTGVSSSLAYTGAGTVASVKVRVNVTHTYKGDLEIALIGPDGTTVLLHNRTGGSADHVNTEFPDLTASAQSLTAFNGKVIAGTWTLRVRDLAAADTGTFVSWTLSLTTTPSL